MPHALQYAVHRVPGHGTRSTGKLLSNMHRSGPNCSMQYVMKGAIDVANSSEPMGVVRSCQSKPRRGMPMPPSLRWTLGHTATAAMPHRQVASTSSSRWRYGPTRFKPPRWFRMMVRLGTALAKADCVALLTPHDAYDLDWIAGHAKLIFDARNAFPEGKRPSIVRL